MNASIVIVVFFIVIKVLLVCHKMVLVVKIIIKTIQNLNIRIFN